MKKTGDWLLWALKITLGSALFALAFDLFLLPRDLNSGGISGLAMVLVHVIGAGSVGLATAIINLPLFIIGGLKVGKTFFLGSLLGAAVSSLCLDLFTLIPVPQMEPLLAAIYGGALGGIGLGIVFAAGASTGGSDIVVRLLKMRFQHLPIGTINIVFDASVVILTGIVFQDISKMLYSGISIFILGQVMDVVVYRFDYSKVALIISPEYEAVAKVVNDELGRGATFLNGQGYYSRNGTKVVLTAVKRQQIADLKRMVTEIDPNAFVIMLDAHQVLGDGFSKYSKDAL